MPDGRIGKPGEERPFRLCEVPNPARDRRRDGRALPHDVTVKLSFMGRRGRAQTLEPEDLPDGLSTGNGVYRPVHRGAHCTANGRLAGGIT